MEAILLLCGDRGFGDVSVQDVLALSKTSRATFYKHFASKEHCFQVAYDAGSEELARRVVGAAHAAPNWRAGVRAGLRALVRVLDEQPLIARCLLVEAYAAGRQTIEKRAEVLRRLAAELDRVRAELPQSAVLPTGISEIVVGGIEGLVRRQVQTGDPQAASELLPELVYLAVMPYLGKEIAAEEQARVLVEDVT